ncbi:lymphocyte-specific protein 1 isoform X5 [Chlorocebus sabaeus]|uniref:lymphocyte-specific protein 1 isoform X5 n=1 Tax=Chlorocebus sabaeus TaxID=60711 RepID=UPI00045DFB91
MRTRALATGPRGQSSDRSMRGSREPRTAENPPGAGVLRGSKRTRPLGPIQAAAGPGRVRPHQHTAAAASVMEAESRRRPFLPRGWLISIPTEGSRPGLHAGEKEDGDEVHLEELSLSKEEPDPEDTVQDNLGAAGAEEEQEEHQKCQQPRTPSPLILEGTIEHSSPPLSPTTKLIDRTESLNRSIEKSNSVKKSQPDLPISKIDQRLEQYTQAIETAGRTPKLARQASIELPSMAVASTKSRWETGEVQAQSATKTPSCKDIVAGDMSKKSLWEQKGGSKTSSTIKSTPSGKRYKFVATGHGKYEKVLVEGGPAP